MNAKTIITSIIIFFLGIEINAGEVLINYNFQNTSLPAGVTSNGIIYPTKAADGVCSMGMIQVNQGGFFQIGVPSCGILIVNMKSTSSSTRTLTVKYKKAGSASFTVATTNLYVSTAATFNISSLFPDIISSVADTIRIEPTSGNIQIHDLYVEASEVLNNQAEILSFKLPAQVGNELINYGDTSITLNVAQGTDVTSIAPSLVQISPFATIHPSSDVVRNFSGKVSYEVIAQDGVTTKTWKIVVNHVVSGEKKMVAFKLSSDQIGTSVIDTLNKIVTVVMPQTTDISNMIPEKIELSAGATIDPLAGLPANFNNPVIYTITAQDNSTQLWTINVIKQPVKYKVNINVKGIGKVTLSPAGGEYTSGTQVTLNAISVLGSTFNGWSGDVVGTEVSKTITVNSENNIWADFSSEIQLDFNKCTGFASVNADNFTGPTTGGGSNGDTVIINGPSEFGKLCQLLYNRINYKYYSNRPLTIVLEEGIYDGTGGTGSVWGNSMLTIQEQGNLTIIGRENVVLKFGINVKRSWNIILRNLHFQDYYDDGINIGEPETHHIWVDHCTVGHPTTMPADTEHPDGGIDVKNGASYVTISWCLYRNSWKTGLVGHSDNNGSVDLGRLKVTYYMNYFYHTNSRNPRVRFGEVHVLNNLHEQVMLYGIVAANSAQVFVENNYFINTDWPMYADRTVSEFQAVYGNNTDDIYTSKTGNYPCVGLKQSGNEYNDSGLPVITAQINSLMLNPGGKSLKFDELNPNSVFDPHTYYNYDVLPASSVKELIPLYAGADKIDFFALTNTTSIRSNEKINEISSIYPNPANQFLRIGVKDIKYQVIIYDLAGKVLYKAQNEPLIPLKKSGIKPGTYIVVISTENATKTHKLIVTN